MDKPSVSPYRALILFIHEKEETLCMCIDFRMLNKQTKNDVYIIPQIDKMLDCLCKARVFLKNDLGKAYHQVAVEPSHTHKTTFFIKYVLFKFQVLPFGLVINQQYFNIWLIRLFRRHLSISCWLTSMTY